MNIRDFIRSYKMIIFPILVILFIGLYQHTFNLKLNIDLGVIVGLSGTFFAFILVALLLTLTLDVNKFTKAIFKTKIWKSTISTMMSSAFVFAITIIWGVFFDSILLGIPFVVGLVDLILSLFDLAQIFYYARYFEKE